MGNNWDPETYLKFKNYRSRPALDLLAQIELETKGHIIDLGCGPGNITRLIKDKWPLHKVSGIDLSLEMIQKAEKIYGNSDIEWLQSDINSWEWEKPTALIFSNAALQWVPQHKILLPKLMKMLEPRGKLAIQIPLTRNYPYQECIRKLISSPFWSRKLELDLNYKNPLEPEEIYNLLSPQSQRINIWTTDYQHILDGENPVLKWIMGTALTPYLSVLNNKDKETFLSEYSKLLDKAYPRQNNGKTLFNMKRLFFIAESK